MEKTIITTGKTIELAIEAALAQLGLERDDVSVDRLYRPCGIELVLVHSGYHCHGS